eukprot:scaffold56467_cov19-Tisochrysis_lutea.AAC.1
MHKSAAFLRLQDATASSHAVASDGLVPPNHQVVQQGNLIDSSTESRQSKCYIGPLLFACACSWAAAGSLSLRVQQLDVRCESKT